MSAVASRCASRRPRGSRRREASPSAALQGAGFSVWESIPGPRPSRCGRTPSGARLTRQAVALAGNAGVPATEREHSVLSVREREVAELVAQGLTDGQIAARLVISPRTAGCHVRHIRTKLGFRSRTQIAAWGSGQPVQ